MTEKGLKGVSNPSAMFLSQHSAPVAGSCVLVTQEGTRPLLVEIQALVDSGGPSPRRLSVGLDRDRFADAWRSSKVDSMIERARLLTDDYDIQSTPSMVVDGRLLTSSGLTAGVPALLPMVDRLVAITRAGRAGTQ